MINQIFRNFTKIRSCKLGNTGESCKLQYESINSKKSSDEKVIIIPDFLHSVQYYKDFIAEFNLNENKSFQILNQRNVGKSEYHYEHNYHVEGKDFTKFIDTAKIGQCSILAFGMGVNTGLAQATANANRVTGFYGIGGSTWDYRRSSLWNNRREILYELADRLTQSVDVSHSINECCKNDKVLASMLSNYVLNGQLNLNLDVLNQSFNHQSQAQFGNATNGSQIGPAKFTLSDNQNEMPIDQICNNIRNNFSQIGRTPELQFNFIPSENNTLIKDQGNVILRDINSFWENQDGVSTEQQNRDEIKKTKPFPRGQTIIRAIQDPQQSLQGVDKHQI